LGENAFSEFFSKKRQHWVPKLTYWMTSTSKATILLLVVTDAGSCKDPFPLTRLHVMHEQGSYTPREIFSRIFQVVFTHNFQYISGLFYTGIDVIRKLDDLLKHNTYFDSSTSPCGHG
jgi:hypothetical protein